MVFDVISDTSGDFLYQKLGTFIDAEYAQTIRKEADGKPSAGYAWPEKKRFPIFSKEATATSEIYAQNQDVPSHVRECIKEAMDMWGIQASVIAKVASVEPHKDEYLLPDQKLLLVRDANEVKTAELLLREKKDNMEVMTRTYAYRRLLEKSVEHGVKLAADSLEMTAQGRCNLPNLLREIDRRVTHVSDKNVKQAYMYLRSNLKKDFVDIIDDIPTQDKIAGLLFELDTQAGIKHRYNRPKNLGFADPIKSVFNTNKEASDFVKLAGREFSVSDVQRLDPEHLSDIIGPDFMEDVLDPSGNVDPEELAQALNILPADLQDQVVSRLF